MTDDKVRENRVRRIAARRGFTLKRSRRRDPEAVDYGQYMLVNERNVVVVGGGVWGFSATLADVEEFFNAAAATRSRISERKGHAKTKGR